MQITKLTDRNIMFTTLESADSNVHMGLILGANRNFIIDTGIGADCVKTMLDYIGNDPKPIVVINTHHDYDHVAGNWVLENSTIVAHKDCPELMEKNFEAQLAWAKENGRYSLGEVRKCLPNLLFEGTYHFPEDSITIFHTPGHTPDSICVYDAIDKVLYAGDACFFDKDGATYLGDNEDLSGFQNLIDALKPYDIDICVTGHWEPAKNAVALLEAEMEALAKRR